MTTPEHYPTPVAAAAISGSTAVGMSPNAGDGSGEWIGSLRRTQSTTVAA